MGLANFLEGVRIAPSIFLESGCLGSRRRLLSEISLSVCVVVGSPDSTMAVEIERWSMPWAAAGLKHNIIFPGPGYLESLSEGCRGMDGSLWIVGIFFTIAERKGLLWYEHVFRQS